MKLSLEGKRALICGSTHGIGRACAILMAERGAHIILAARNEEKITSVMSNLAGSEHSYICADFDNPDDLKQKNCRSFS